MREINVKRATQLSIISFLIFIMLLSLGCAAQANEPVVEATPETEPPLVWRITIESSELTTNLSSTKAVVEYGGTENQVNFSDQPEEGNAYLLLLLNIDKTQPGKEKFIWSELAVTDSDGNAYSRLEDDTFLELHGLPRIKATDLSIGNNQGYVCFQIPLTVDSSLLTLVYSAENSKQSIPFSATAE